MGGEAVEEAYEVGPPDSAGEAVVRAIDPRQAEWDILIRLLELDAVGIEALSKAGIKSMGDVELFGNGAAAADTTSSFVNASIEGLNLVTKQKFLVIATFLLNDGKLTAESTLAEMARSNQSKTMIPVAAAAAATESAETPAPVKRGRGRPKKNPVEATANGTIAAAATDGTDLGTPSLFPMKRGPGRPRKHPIELGASPPPAKRGRGRPRKDAGWTTVAGPTPAPAKRSPGRPRKHPLAEPPYDAEDGDDEMDEDYQPVKRGPGRPRKNPAPGSPAPVKRGPGRPRKNPLPADGASPSPTKRGPGRPRKTPLPPTDPTGQVVKRGPGRPRKNPIAAEAAAAAANMPKRGPGRPRKHPIAAEAAAAAAAGASPVKRGPGRPRKTAAKTVLVNSADKIGANADAAGSPPAKRPRGRPRKNPLPEESLSEEKTDPDDEEDTNNLESAPPEVDVDVAAAAAPPPENEGAPENEEANEEGAENEEAPQIEQALVNEEEPLPKPPAPVSATEVYRGPPTDILENDLAWPEGWIKVTTERATNTEGKTRLDHCWVSPGGKRLRSMKAVQAFLNAMKQLGAAANEDEAWKLAQL